MIKQNYQLSNIPSWIWKCSFVHCLHSRLYASVWSWWMYEESVGHCWKVVFWDIVLAACRLQAKDTQNCVKPTNFIKMLPPTSHTCSRIKIDLRRHLTSCLSPTSLSNTQNCVKMTDFNKMFISTSLTQTCWTTKITLRRHLTSRVLLHVPTISSSLFLTVAQHYVCSVIWLTLWLVRFVVGQAQTFTVLAVNEIPCVGKESLFLLVITPIYSTWCADKC